MSSKESQQLLKTVIDNSPVGVITTDLNNRIVVFNRNAEEIFGYSSEEVTGKELETLFITSLNRKAQATESNKNDSGFEVLGLKSNGSVFPAYIVANPVISEEGSNLAHLFLIYDIAVSKSFQEMLMSIDRYFYRNEITGVISHDLNNLLSVLMGNIELTPMLLKSGKQDKALERLESMKKTVNKIAKFSDSLVESNPEKVEFGEANINQLVENILAFLKSQKRFENISTQTNLDNNLPPVQIDAALIQQAVIDILFNAAEALREIDGDKQITITTSLITSDNNQRVSIVVKDNGPGVVKEMKQALFNKRFTTKRKGHGTGLINCRKILELHQGTINYNNDNGAVFTLVMPVVQTDFQNTDSISQPATA